MEKNQKTPGVAVPGTAPKKKITRQECREFVKKDTAMCIHMLQAILADENTANSLADFLHGRYLNAEHKKELDAQTDLKI